MKKIFITLLPILMLVALMRTLNDKPLLNIDTYIANLNLKDIDINAFDQLMESVSATRATIENFPRWEEEENILENLWNSIKGIATAIQSIFIMLTDIILAIPLFIVETIVSVIMMIIRILGFY